MPVTDDALRANRPCVYLKRTVCFKVVCYILIIKVINVHMVAPLRKIKVSAFPLYLTALEVHRFATRIFLFGYQRHTVIGIHNHTPGIDAAHEEILFIGIAGESRYSERLVDRHPPYTFKIHLRSIVQVPSTGMHHETALEMRGNTADAA